MTTALRWRNLILQVGLIGVLGFCAGFLFWGSNLVGGMVHDQLAAQQIHFPAQGSAALSPAGFPDLQQFAGQQLATGDQAKAYANGFIGRHLEKVAGGRTYSQVGVYALWAGIGLAVATVAVFAIFLYELVLAPRRETQRVRAGGRRTATVS